METIFTTKQQLYAADKERHKKQWKEYPSYYKDNMLADIVELPVKTHSARWAWATVDSLEGCGEPHTIKLSRYMPGSLDAGGVFYTNKDECIKGLIEFYMNEARECWDEVMESLNLPNKYSRIPVQHAHPDNYQFLDEMAAGAKCSMERVLKLIEPLMSKYEEEAAKRWKVWEKEYNDAPKGTPEELYGYERLYLESELADSAAVVCFRATRRGSGFYYEELESGLYMATWRRVTVRVAEQLKHRDNWCPVMWPMWREAVYQKPEQSL